MTTIFKKRGIGTELVGEVKPRRKIGVQSPDPKKQEAQRNKQRTKKDEARHLKAKKAAIRKNNSKKQDKQRLLTQNIFSLSKFSQKDAFEKLKHFSRAGLEELRKLAEQISITVSDKKKNSILNGSSSDQKSGEAS